MVYQTLAEKPGPWTSGTQQTKEWFTTLTWIIIKEGHLTSDATGVCQGSTGNKTPDCHLGFSSAWPPSLTRLTLNCPFSLWPDSVSLESTLHLEPVLALNQNCLCSNTTRPHSSVTGLCDYLTWPPAVTLLACVSAICSCLQKRPLWTL
jgi:hypothetical protein